MDKNKNDLNDFKTQLYNLDKTSIINQLPSYNIKNTDYFISSLQNEYDQQKTINMILKHKNFDSQIGDISSFIDSNSSIINKQYDNLKSISSDLQNIVQENQELQNQKIQLNDLIHSKQYNQIATKLKEIKSEKEKIKSFLEKNGIISLI